MKIRFLYTLLFPLVLPVELYASELTDKEVRLVSMCERYIEQGKVDSAQSVLNGLSSIIKQRMNGEYTEDFLDVLQRETKECAEFAFGPTAGFHPEISKFQSTLGAQQYSEAKQRRVASAEREAELQAQARVEEAQNRLDAERLRLEVARRVFQSCEILAKRDEVSAFTNSLCVESFLKNGLPN